MSAFGALLTGLLLASSLAGPATGAPPIVRLDVQIGSADFSEGLDGVTLRVDSGETVNLRVRVFDLSEPASALDVDDPSTLLELRESGDPGSGRRFADWEHPATGVYEISNVIDGPGEFLLLVLPDVTDRSLLSESSTDHLTLVVAPGSPEASRGPSSSGLVVSLVLAAALVVLVILATRGRRRIPKEPTPHDTWWNSP